jgi:hypothetical protein
MLRRMGSSDSPCVFIVPEHYSHEAERALCRARGPVQSARCEVLSFTRLARRVAETVGGVADQVLDPGGRILLMHQAVTQTAAHLTVYRVPSRKPSFLSGLAATVDECKSYGVTPDALIRVGETLSGTEGDKLHDIGLIYAAYDSLAARIAADPRDTLDRLTAGLRQSEDPVEQLGIARSRAAMEQAELILYLCDRSVPFGPEDMRGLEQAMACAPTVLVWNKCDLPGAEKPAALPQGLAQVAISARQGMGLEELEQAVAAHVPASGEGELGALLTNARQAEAARRALQAVELARKGLEAGYTPDAVLVDVEAALAALGELTGRSVRQDITSRIFERFCVGK